MLGLHSYSAEFQSAQFCILNFRDKLDLGKHEGLGVCANYN